MTNRPAITGRYRLYRKSLIPARLPVWKKDRHGRTIGESAAGPAPGIRGTRSRFEGIMKSFDPTADYAEIREGVAQVCARFPGEYWRVLDRERAYPKEFVDALVADGYLAAMIPETYGGSGLNLTAAAAILEEIHRNGCNAAACHAQMYTMGTVLRHGSDAQKDTYLPKIASGELRLQAFGVTEPTSGTDTLALKTTAKRVGDEYVINGPENLDVPRRALRPDAAARPHHAAGGRQEAHRRALGVPDRPPGMRRARRHHPADPDDDQSLHHGSLLRQRSHSGLLARRRRGAGLPLHPLGHERRAHPDRRRVHWRCEVVARQGVVLCP